MSEEQAIFGGILVVILGIFAAIFVVYALVCYFLMTCFQKIPSNFRRLEPGLVWLLLIPCFGLIWQFFVLPRLALSYQDYFRSTGRRVNDDCGHGVAMACCICNVVAAVPVLALSGLAGIASLVLLIIFLVKAHELRKEVDVPGEDVFA